MPVQSRLVVALRHLLLLALAGATPIAASATVPTATVPTATVPIVPGAALPIVAAPDALPLPPLGDDLMERIKLGVDPSDRMTMPVEIGGIGPWPFIIDTGSERSIVATELARQLDLPELPPVNILSIAGPDRVAAVRLDRLKFGSHEVNDIPVLSIAHDTLGSAGLIGLDGLKDKRLTLDFRKRRMEIGRSAPTNRFNQDRNIIVVEARSKYGQLILVGSKVDGHKVSVILDTGAELSIGNMALFAKLKAKRLVVPPQQVTITSVTGLTVTALYTVVRQLNIESVQLENVPMVFLDAAPFAQLDLADKPAMLLGMRMLRMFDRVAIDFGSRHVDFELPESRNFRGGEREQMASR